MEGRRRKMDDKRIVELFLARAETAISEAAKKYGRYCRYIAMRVLGNEQDAEEVENDTYVKLWNSIPPKKPDPLKPYVGAVARNIALNRVEERSAQKRGGEVALALEELSECLPDSSGEELGESFVLREALNSFLASLDAKTRIIFMQRYFYTCSVREIAAGRGLKESAVTMLLFRTRQKLKEHLHKEGFDL
jgi:RNA polymerase sigma-70 factor (ECF subfamily)